MLIWQLFFCPKPLSFRGLRPLDPTSSRDLPASQIRYKICTSDDNLIIKPLSFWGFRPLDPTPICVLPVSQIRYQNMLICSLFIAQNPWASGGLPLGPMPILDMPVSHIRYRTPELLRAPTWEKTSKNTLIFFLESPPPPCCSREGVAIFQICSDKCPLHLR